VIGRKNKSKAKQGKTQRGRRKEAKKRKKKNHQFQTQCALDEFTGEWNEKDKTIINKTAVSKKKH
jgi:ATP adenylyltransferase/5',5'''-P-1,P-4-tetraphosphate phosphorylase II